MGCVHVLIMLSYVPDSLQLVKTQPLKNTLFPGFSSPTYFNKGFLKWKRLGKPSCAPSSFLAAERSGQDPQ